jgi:hypothetical protein
MEKEQLIKKVLLATGTAVLSVSLSGAVGTKDVKGIVPYQSTPYDGLLTPILPSKTTEPLLDRISESKISSGRNMELAGEKRDNSPGKTNAGDVLPFLIVDQSTTVPSLSSIPELISIPKTTKNPKNLITQIPEQVINIDSQFNDAKQEIISHPGIFSLKWQEDFNIYGRIYMEVSEKFANVDWFLLWIVHEAETGASDSITAFNGGSAPYVGGMQRNPAYWSESYVEQASQGLEFLAKFSQRHSSDWREIAAAASEISNNLKQYKNLGKEKSVLNALLLYSAEGPATERFNKWLVLKDVFGKTQA